MFYFKYIMKYEHEFKKKITNNKINKYSANLNEWLENGIYKM